MRYCSSVPPSFWGEGEAAGGGGFAQSLRLLSSPTRLFFHFTITKTGEGGEVERGADTCSIARQQQGSDEDE